MNTDAIKGAVFSKTVWVNGVISVAGCLDILLSNSGLVTAVFPVLAPYMAVFGAVNVILRFFTSKSLADKAPVEDHSV